MVSKFGTVTPDDFRRIREVFEAALERPSAERRAFAEEACAGNTTLLTEVHRMLAAEEGERHPLLDNVSRRAELPANDSHVSHCPSCRAAVEASDQFCAACGSPVSPSNEGRFRAGALFAGRFRIVAVLGRGGMGEVYRAHDLELGQPVALKFLTALRRDERARSRLRSEVRLARQISHPNVCRVYDLGEAHGELYLSMEYVDGEDLAALLKRIGRVPGDKGTEIARKLCAGLAAAHAKGVLHRDLKPGNIMIDGTGEVRIMDFGLAAVADRLDPSDVGSGTPAYMAPEQLAGKEATVQSDLYALGLVLYELFTGKVPHAATTVGDLQRLRQSHPTTTPGMLVPELTPRVERVILRCLEPESKARPSSALDVAASLPGGDPLAEALAAGETPSPEMVAAFGTREGLRPVPAWILLGFTVAGAIGAVLMNERLSLIQRLASGKPPDVLVDRAGETLRRLGVTAEPRDTAFGYQVDPDVIEYVRDAHGSWDHVNARRAVSFFFRSSPQTIQRRSSQVSIAADVPALHVPGEAQVILDLDARIQSIDIVPGGDVAPAPADGVDWAALLGQAGFDPVGGDLAPALPTSRPRFFADTQHAWHGTLPGARDVPMQVEGASVGGRLVRFQVSGPRGSTADVAAATSPTHVADRYFTVELLALACAWAFARRNLRLGRGDRQGAIRLAVVVAVAQVMGGLARDHRPPVQETLPLLADAVARAMLLSAAVWALYIALEPFVRGRWPQVLVSWSRLVSGQWRDALVGRDVLAGCATGVAATVLHFLQVSASGRANEEILQLASLFLPPATFASWLGLVLVDTILMSIGFFFLLFLLRIVLRSDRLAAVAWILAGAGINVLPFGFGPGLLWVASLMLLMWVIVYLALTRAGFVAYLAGRFVLDLLVVYPITFNESAWYAGPGFASLAVVMALALYAFTTSLGGRARFAAYLR